MPDLHKRRKVIKDALLDADDNRSELSATPKLSRSTAGVDQRTEASQHTHVSRQSKPPSVHEQHASPIKSKRDSIASHMSQHSQVPAIASQQERRSPALSSRRSHISHHITSRPASPSPSHISQQRQRQPSVVGSQHGSIPPFLLPEQSSYQEQSPLNNVSLRRDRSSSERSRGRNPSDLNLNDKQYADLSKVIYEAFNTTLQQIEEEDSNTRRDEAYKRIVAIAKKKVMNALKEIQVPPKVADTVFDINLHKEKLATLRDQLKSDVNEYVDLQLARTMAEYQLEKEKERLKEIQIKLSEEQASFKAEHDQLIERYPLLNAPPPTYDYTFSIMKYPASLFNPKRDI